MELEMGGSRRLGIVASMGWRWYLQPHIMPSPETDGIT
jgi:hypothetical protein